MIKGMIFDVDGTLLDSLDAWKDVGNKYLNQLQIHCDTNLDAILEHMDFIEGVKYIKKTYQLHQSEEEIAEGIKSIIEDQYAYHILLKDGVKQFLEKCKKKNYILTILTAGDKQLAKKALQRLKILEYFDRIYSCEQIGLNKQNKDSFLYVANQMKLEIEECVVIEDAYYAIKTAHDAGFYTIAIYDKENQKDEKRIKKIANEYHQSFQTITI